MTAKAGSGVRGMGRTGRGRARAAGGLRLTALLLAGAASQAGCGHKTTISVRVVTPSGAADPFLNAASVRMTLANSPGSIPATAAVTGGKFTVNLDLDAPMSGTFLQLLVEALDASGSPVARGNTPNFDPQNTDLAVYVNRPGQVGSTDLHLPDDMVTPGSVRARQDLMGAALLGRQVSPAEPAIGALLVGGASDDGSLVNEAVMYKTLGHQLIDAGSPSGAGAPSVARRGGVMVASADATAGQQTVLWGGAAAGGALPTIADKFDPGVSTLAMVWAHPEAPYFDAGVPGAYGPSVGQVGALSLVCGGSGMAPPLTADLPLAQAVLIRRNAAPMGSTDQTARLGVTRLPPAMDGSGPMVAARYLHTVTAKPDGGSALVFGGLSAADSVANKSAGELFSVVTNTFSAITFQPPTTLSRRGHIAARLTTGQILIAGGYHFDGMGKKLLDDSALLIDLGGTAQAPTASVQPLPQLLKTPRYAASVTTAGKELVICGGFDAYDKALADCEVFAADTAMRAARSPIALPSARAGHLALTLENGLTLLVGGVDQDNHALSTIDIYTSAN